MKDTYDILTVSFDSGSKDESTLCVSRKYGEKIIMLKMEFGEQADILYHLLTEQTAKAEIKPLEQEPCEDVAKERYEDLCEYFGGAKDILKHREDFKAWLGRVKWHIHKYW